MTSRKTKLNFIPLLLIVMAIILIAYLGFSILICRLVPSIKLEGLSTLISSVFSALAFGAVIVTIYQQQKTIEIQIEELKQSVDEQKLANAEFSKQNQNIELQRFENTFFRLLENQRQVLNNVTFEFNGKKRIGFDALIGILDATSDKYDAIYKDSHYNMRETGTDDLEKLMRSFKHTLSGPNLFSCRYLLSSIIMTHGFIQFNSIGLSQDQKISYFKILFHNTPQELFKVISLYRIALHNSLFNFTQLLNDLDVESIFKELDSKNSNFEDRISHYLKIALDQDII